MDKLNHNTDTKNPKIYETLEYIPKPDNYSSKIPWSVQLQIGATNGIHYKDRVGKLNDYPVYELPIKHAKSSNDLFLDIGCGWGRWLNAADNKGYIPIGIDLRLEFCKTARMVLNDLGKNGYTVVADLENIPFVDNAFEKVWSFSVIQHTHYKRLTNCLKHIGRVLSPSGSTTLEFPNKSGIRNNFSNVSYSEKYKDDYNSWCVRYYTPEEYKEIFNLHLNNFSYTAHSFLGIGVLKEDLKYVSLKNKVLCAASLLGTSITKVIHPLKRYADSIYISADKKNQNSTISNSVKSFLDAHKKDPSNNLNIVHLLRCPITGGEVELNNDKTKVISKEGNVFYPVINETPIMITSEAIKI